MNVSEFPHVKALSRKIMRNNDESFSYQNIQLKYFEVELASIQQKKRQRARKLNRACHWANG